MTLASISQLSFWKGIFDILSSVGIARLGATIAGAYAGYRVVYELFLSPLRHVPGPFLARLTPMRRQYLSALGQTAQMAIKEYEKYGDIYVQGPNAVSISSPSDIRTVLASHAFVKANFYAALDLFGIENTVSARDPAVASLRKRQLGPYLNPAYVAEMQTAILKHGFLALQQKWEGQLAQSTSSSIEVNYSDDFTLATLDTVCALAFGRELGCLERSDATVAHWAEATVKVHGMRAMVPLLGLYPFSLAIKGLDTQFQRLTAFCRDSISRRRELLETGGEKPVDLLQAFLDAQDPESKISMSETQLQAETIVVLLAGTDTSSNTMQWLVHLLLLHPEIYAQAVSEVRGKFAADHVITYTEAKKHLPFVNACIYEALRLYPLGGGYVPRISPAGGITLQGYFIPEGTEINANFYGASIHKGAWAEPLRYDPTRFLANEEARLNFFAFSPGVRICPGRHLAWAEMSTIIANMLKDYDWSLPKDLTHLGPDVLDKHGYPCRMESAHFLVTAPVNPRRDCRLVLSKHP
ncbi:cytochrome P450 [Linderina pennispora]|uniref:Cytochrome P450 n=1 Tax=Linderina pennispora TaxID=61395 RepID=A0A1Y1W3J4_9FUNG|nr:cytochrome P450 [Linderina pennispora]ORX68101.1 cytochrome P450 [Linderina pennispora]